MTEQEKNYEHLIWYGEGDKEIAHKNGTLVVKEIDPELGITIYRKGEWDEPVLCLVHPFVQDQRWKRPQQPGYEKAVAHFRALFDALVHTIEQGELGSDFSEQERRIDQKFAKWVKKPDMLILASTNLNDFCAFS